MPNPSHEPPHGAPSARARAYRLLESAGRDGGAHRLIDGAIIALIVANVAAVMAGSVAEIGARHAHALALFETISVALFTVEYLLRAWVCVEAPDGRWRRPVAGRLRHALTPLALVDLVAIAPFYLALFTDIAPQVWLVLRITRLLRLARFSSAVVAIAHVFRTQSESILAALLALAILLVLAASGMYYFEHDVQPRAFASIPTAIWWAVVTLTTVGYGDVVPQTVGGRFFAGFVMLTGVGMIAVPAGMLASAFSEYLRTQRETYETLVDKAMADGHITAQDRHLLEHARAELGLERGDAARILAHVVREILLRGQAAACPHCGKALNAPHTGPPTHG
ncbi:MAG: ion transporter [Gammaproteobacteria bacterium]